MDARARVHVRTTFSRGAEVERAVAAHAAALTYADVAATLAVEPRLLQWAHLRRDVARDARWLVAFYRFACEVRPAERELRLASLAYPRADDRVFAADGEL